jgi:hypothetical protein
MAHPTIEDVKFDIVWSHFTPGNVGRGKGRLGTGCCKGSCHVSFQKELGFGKLRLNKDFRKQQNRIPHLVEPIFFDPKKDSIETVSR